MSRKPIRSRKTALDMAEAMIPKHKRASKKRGCSWRQVVRDAQRELCEIMREPGRKGDGLYATACALLNAMPMIKGAATADVYEVVVRAQAVLQYLCMDASRPAPPPPVAAPSSSVVH